MRVPAKKEAISKAWSSRPSGYMAQRISSQSAASAGVTGRISVDAIVSFSMVFGR